MELQFVGSDTLGTGRTCRHLTWLGERGMAPARSTSQGRLPPTHLGRLCSLPFFFLFRDGVSFSGQFGLEFSM